MTSFSITFPFIIVCWCCFHCCRAVYVLVKCAVFLTLRSYRTLSFLSRSLESVCVLFLPIFTVFFLSLSLRVCTHTCYYWNNDDDGKIYINFLALLQLLPFAGSEKSVQINLIDVMIKITSVFCRFVFFCTKCDCGLCFAIKSLDIRHVKMCKRTTSRKRCCYVLQNKT